VPQAAGLARSALSRSCCRRSGGSRTSCRSACGAASPSTRQALQAAAAAGSFDPARGENVARRLHLFIGTYAHDTSAQVSATCMSGSSTRASDTWQSIQPGHQTLTVPWRPLPSWTGAHGG
jgi:hypothetical protein